MADLSGQQVGKYRLIRQIGRGSFGEVYLAEDTHHSTLVAIKILLTRVDGTERLESFIHEARLIVLNHPHIIRLRDFGIENDMLFLVMDYIPGGTMRQRHPQGTLLALETVISYVKQIAEALDYAHNEGWVHRDVKPENMLIGSNNQVLLGDFGIVALSYTVSPERQKAAGTIPYMAPEQIQDQPVRASDQYALGAIAYEWLTGTPPFHARLWDEIAIKHIQVPPLPLREKMPDISPEVDHVVLRALEKDPKKRFDSCKAFADALEQASRPLVGTTLLTFDGHSDWVTAVAWSPDGTYIASASNDATVQVWNSTTGKHICSYNNHTSRVEALTWSPDGTYIASASADTTVQIWQAATAKPLFTYYAHCGAVLTVAWSPDGTRIASAGADTTVHVWQAMTRDHLCTYHRHTKEVEVVAWSPDSTRIASGTYNTMVQVWEVATENAVLTHQGHSGGVFAVAWSPNEDYIASGSDDTTVQVWEATTGNTVFTYKCHTDGIRAIAWSPSGYCIASAGLDKTVQVWQAVR